MDKQYERILSILQNENTRRTIENLKKYLAYLKKNITYPCLLTGIEDFLWEEFYVLGPGNKAEYEELKKTRPSYTDKFELIEFSNKIDVNFGLFVRVKRCSDKQVFSIPLADLKAKERKSINFQLLKDFSVWFVNS